MLTLNLRDCQILALIDGGLATEAIARRLGVSRYTIRDRIRELRVLLGKDLRMWELPEAARKAGVCEEWV